MFDTVASLLLRTVFIALLTLSGVSLHAESRCEQENRAFLWEISHQSTTSYLLGSIHYLKKEMYPLPAVMEEAFQKSEALLVEVNVSGENLARMVGVTMEKARYPENDTLRNHITDSTYERLARFFADNHLDISYFAAFKPWFIGMTIAGIELMKLGYDPNLGIDRHFMKRATLTDPVKEILELEGIDFQIDLFESMDDEEGEQFLLATLNEAEQYKAELEEIVDAWWNGDGVRLEQLMENQLAADPGRAFIRDTVILERNQRMAERIVEHLNENRSFLIIVGAAHLVGEQGLVNLLRGQGFKVEQAIRSSSE